MSILQGGGEEWVGLPSLVHATWSWVRWPKHLHAWHSCSGRRRCSSNYIGVWWCVGTTMTTTWSARNLSIPLHQKRPWSLLRLPRRIKRDPTLLQAFPMDSTTMQTRESDGVVKVWRVKSGAPLVSSLPFGRCNIFAVTALSPMHCYDEPSWQHHRKLCIMEGAWIR